jgi:hypothetical protein
MSRKPTVAWFVFGGLVAGVLSWGLFGVASAEGHAGDDAGIASPPPPMRVVTADTDPNQLVRGFEWVRTAAPTRLTDGPLILTTATGGVAVGLLYVMDKDEECGTSAPLAPFPSLPDGSEVVGIASSDSETLSGARIFVSSTQSLCTRLLCVSPAATCALAWAGFRPY